MAIDGMGGAGTSRRRTTGTAGRRRGQATAQAIDGDPSEATPHGSSLPIADGFELDLVARELRHAGRPVHLRPLEFELLATLAADPGRAFTRRQLIDLAWAPDTSPDPRTVDVHIHWLRTKIEPERAHPIHLVTVRGYGYRFDPPGR